MAKTTNKGKITTIKLGKNTKDRLDALKEHHRESYDEVIAKTLDIINITIRNPTAGSRIFRRIKVRKNRKNKKEEVYQEHTDQEEHESEEHEFE